MKRLLITCALVCLFIWPREAVADIITGPTLNQIATDQYTGLMFSALASSYLQGFVFQNQGAASQVELGLVSTNPANGALYVSSVVGTISTPANTPSFTASNLNWQMNAGSNYILVGETSNNTDFAFYSNFPTSDGQISIFTGVFSFDVSSSIATQTDAWGGFNNIATASAPEPSSFFLVSLSAAAGFFGWRRARRQKAAENSAAACA